MPSPFRREVAGRAIGIIAVSTLLLTASFVGVQSLFQGNFSGTDGRLPFYVLVMAATFVASVVSLTRQRADWLTSILGAVGIATLCFVLVALAGEGIFYVLENPGEALNSNQLVYFLAAGLMGTGLGFWLLSYWRDIAIATTEDRRR